VFYSLLSMLLRIWRVSYVYFVIDVIEDMEGYLSYSLLSMLLRTWRVSYVYFVNYVIEDLEG
jgi:hypothetical protein